jgi:hypothetical protein
MNKYHCDVCHEPITKKDPGVLHETKNTSGIVDGMRGFAFYMWTDELAELDQANDMGHVHNRCIVAQAQKYMTGYRLDRRPKGKKR